MTLPDGLGAEQRAVLAVALGEVGVAEVPAGSNAGPVLRFGGKPGQPWCAFAATWCYHQALGRWPLGMMRQTGGTGTLRSHAKPYRKSKPEPGDFAYKPRFDGKGRKVGGHVGIVLAVSESGRTTWTLEGNRGDAFRLCTRKTSEWSEFWRDYRTPQPHLWTGWTGEASAGGAKGEA